MPREKRERKADTTVAISELTPSARSNFISEVNRLIDLGLWMETDYLISHRFGDHRLLAYAKPKPGVSFYLGGQKWRAIGKRTLKENQYHNEFYHDHEGMLRHVDVPASRYAPEQKDFHEREEENI